MGADEKPQQQDEEMEWNGSGSHIAMTEEKEVADQAWRDGSF